jgi:signal peptidase II
MILLILIGNFGCDRISKIVIRQRIRDDQQFTFFNDHLTVTRVENSGAFLSLGNTMSHPLRFLFLSIIPLLVLCYGLFFLFTNRNISKTTLTGICFVLGGGLGNVFDRIVYGSVTDFLHINFGIFQTGVFNMADVSIMSGMILIIFDYFKRREALDERIDQLP